jgi:hypothetical protein
VSNIFQFGAASVVVCALILYFVRPAAATTAKAGG